MPPKIVRPLSLDLQAAMEDFRNICKESVSGAKAYEYGSQGYKDCIRHFLPSSSEVAQLAVQPGDAADVSKMMKVLRDRPTVPFAVKGGGHAMVPGSSSTTGILISMARLDTIEYDPSTQLVKVGAGCLWDAVYAKMYPYRRNVIGGSASQGVGVAGWMLGGGYSLKSSQYGLGIDNVVEFEVVVPDGRVLIANASKEKKLYQALRGGGNNFGIVTHFTIKTYPQTETYGGSFMVPGDRAEEAKQAIADFVANETRKEASLVSAFRHRLVNGTLDYSISFMCVFDGPKPQKPVFEQFKKLMTSGTAFTVDPAGWEGAAGYRPRALNKAVNNAKISKSTKKDKETRTVARIALDSDDEGDGSGSATFNEGTFMKLATSPPMLRAYAADSFGGNDDADPFSEMSIAAADALFSNTYAYEMRTDRGTDTSAFSSAGLRVMRFSADTFAEDEAASETDEEGDRGPVLTMRSLVSAENSNAPIDRPIQITRPTDSMGELQLRGRFGCIMVSKYTKPLLDKMAEEAEKSATYLTKKRGNMVLVDAWPFHPEIFKNSPPGAAWPHEPNAPMGPCIAYFLWEREEDDEFWLTKLKGTLNRIRVVARNLGLTTSSPAYYSNVSLESVPAKRVFRNNMKWLMKVKQEYDPLDVMGRTGNVHKIPLPGKS
ncbi:hypothetical protein C8Q77DRAFT_1072982 [Trametes polyzona]|nr:hypothetical protein C8Q77DRAFT_1072982 [Trametes polyzona]